MQLVTVNSIRDGVIQALKTKFPALDVWGEEIEQGFEEPCFFVKLLNVGNTRELGRRFRRTHSFDIHYFPDGQRNRNAHDMAEALYALLLTIEVDGETYYTTGANHDVTDNVLHFFIDIDFIVTLPSPNDPKMQSLDERSWIK